MILVRCLVLSLGAAGALTGCHMSQHAGDTRARAAILGEAHPVPAAAWPARRTAGLPTIDNGQSVDAELGEKRPTPAALPSHFKITLRQACTPVGQGWIVEKTTAIAEASRDVNGPRSFEYYSWSRADPAAAALPCGVFSDGVLAGQIKEVVKKADFRLGFDFIPPEKGPSKGLVIFCPGMAGWDYQVPVVEALRARGWSVLTYIQLTAKGDSDASPEERRSARELTSRELKDAGLIHQCAEAAVPVVSDFIADFAYGYEAALSYLEKDDPELRQGPTVLVACSVGAILAPTLSARLGERISAAVLIGGGANLCEILATTPAIQGYAILRLDSGYVCLTPALAKRVRGEYLQQAALDPYSTAPLLASRPVLVLQAANDGIIDSEYGDLLWERLGRPERWTGNYGHLLLFYFLEDHAARIADWVEKAVAAGSAEPAAAAR